jgi:DNA polymerase-3 subunit alpha
VTDLANLFGMVRFYKEARGKGVKPIAGCDVWITNDADRDKPSACCCVKNRMAICSCAKLLSQAWLTNQYKAAPKCARNGSRRCATRKVAMA